MHKEYLAKLYVQYYYTTIDIIQQYNYEKNFIFKINEINNKKCYNVLDVYLAKPKIIWGE